MIQSGTFWLVLFGSAIGFWLLPARLRYWFIGLVSLAYLISLEPAGVSILLAWTLLFFYAAPHALRGKQRSALVLTGLVLSILSYLAWYKAVPVILAAWHPQSAAAAIIPPLGISYFTFKLMHYAIETARGTITDRGLDKFFAYVFLFPIFTAGPIERYDHFLAHLAPAPDRSAIATGLTRIAVGLIKVTIIGGLIVPGNLPGLIPATADDLLAMAGQVPVWRAWAFVIATYIQEYVNFSAYSDIAIGASLLFGIRIMENFNVPIIAANISDFWRRWHMTLSGWCQTYVYMPVMARTRSIGLATFATFVLIGVWHGVSLPWLAWGLFHSIGVLIYANWARVARRWAWYRRSRQNAWRFAGVPLTFAFVSASYAFTATGRGLHSGLQLFLLLFGVRHVW